MTQPFNPLPFVFLPFEDVPESSARVVSESIRQFHAGMLVDSAAISREAHAAFVAQWPTLLDLLLLRATRDSCAALRAGFAGYPALN